MSRTNQFRRAVATLKSRAGSSAVPTVGNRSLHQYWALLKTHFRSVLLAPQSLSDGANTQWTWREPVDAPSLTPAELATVRKRLSVAQRSFADSVEDAPAPTTADSRLAGSVLPQLQAHMDAVVNTLVALPDFTLAGYVARSEQGLSLHSWGLPAALTPHYPDNTDCEIAGTVFVSEKPAADREVLLESSAGAVLERTRSDAAGRFRFSKVAPGRYRARAVADRETLPAKGVDVEIDRASVTGIELRDSANDRSAAAQEPGAPSRRQRVVPFILFGSLTIMVIGVVWWRSTISTAVAVAPAQSLTPANVAPKTISRARADQIDARPPSASSTVSKANAVEAPRTPTRKAELPARESTPRPTSTTERRSAGTGVEPSGAPAGTAPPSSVATASASRASAAGNLSSSAGVAAPGHASPTSATAASNPNSTSASPPRGNATSTPPSTVAATNTPTPPPTAPTSPSPPKPTAAAKSTPSPTPTPSPELEPESPPSTSTANLDSATSTPSPSSAVSSTSSPDKSPMPDLSDPPSVDRATDSSPPAEQTATTSSAPSTDEPPSTPSGSSVSANSPSDTSTSPDFVARLPRRVTIRVARWQQRLLQDTILPTAPTRVGDDDAIEALREQLFRERRTHIPNLFKPPVTRVGFVVEFPDDQADLIRVHWRDTSSTANVRFTVVDRRAEISWPGTPPLGTASTLVADDGRALVSVAADHRGALTLSAIAGARCWPWIGVERPASDDVRLTAAEWTTRLEWRVLSGAPAAPTWHREDHWLNDHGHRFDLILGSRALGLTTHSLALIDRITGWAVVTEIEQAQETPATAVSLSR